jgi:hypothetical protein
MANHRPSIINVLVALSKVQGYAATVSIGRKGRRDKWNKQAVRDQASGVGDPREKAVAWGEGGGFAYSLASCGSGSAISVWLPLLNDSDRPGERRGRGCGFAQLTEAAREAMEPGTRDSHN